MVSGTLLKVYLVFDPNEWNTLLNLGDLERHTEIIDPADNQDLQPFEDFYDNFLDDEDDASTSSSIVPEGEETDVSDDKEEEDGTFEFEDHQEIEGADEPYRTRFGHRVKPVIHHAGAKHPDSDPPYIKAFPKF